MFASDSLDAWWCFSTIWKFICIFKTLIRDVKDSLLRTLFCVAHLSRTLNTFEGVDPELARCVQMDVGFWWSIKLTRADLWWHPVNWELGWEPPKNGFSWEQFGSFGFQRSLKMLEAKLILLFWDNSRVWGFWKTGGRRWRGEKNYEKHGEKLVL